MPQLPPEDQLLRERIAEPEKPLAFHSDGPPQRSTQCRDHALRESQAVLKAMLACMGDSVLIADATGQQLVECNDVFAAFHGFKSRHECPKLLTEYEAIRDMFLSDGTLATPDMRPAQRAIRGETRTNVLYNVRSKDTGRTYNGAYSFGPIRDEQGTIIGCAVIARDITEHVRFRYELKAANKAKDEFLAVLSHELRNPLNPVMAAAALLQENPNLGDDARQQLEIIRRNVELEAHLIDDLLDVTRIERGKVELDLQPVELLTILHRAAEVCQPEIHAKNIEFTIDAPETPYPLHGDAARLQQVFWNLIKNAVKFTPAAGRVAVRCRRLDPATLSVEIQDTGEGITPELLPRLFHAFEQGERRTTRQFGGLGLGLAISKALVELHGGQITAHSDGKGRGATLRVLLPLPCAPLPAPAQPASSTEPAAPAAAQVQQPLRILLVEDHADTAHLMRQVLARHGHRVTIAADIAGALHAAHQDHFDLLLSDLGLPDGSGTDLLRQLRRQGQDLPAIALSGYGREEDLRQTHAAGFRAHLVKPFDPHRLHETITRALAPV